MEKFQNNLNIIKIIFKYKLLFSAIIIAAVLLSAVFSSSFFIKPRFKSNAIIYPTNVHSFSDESESEQMLQVLQSGEFLDSLDQKFNLGEKYGLSKKDPFYRNYFENIFNSRAKISKTPYDGVSITFEDESPELAYEVTKEFIALYNRKLQNYTIERSREEVELYTKMIEHKRAYIKDVQNKIIKLGVEHGIYDIEAQAKEVTKGYLNTMDGSGNRRANIKEVKQTKEAIEKYGSELLTYQSDIKYLVEELAKVVNDRDQSQKYLDAPISFYKMVSPPVIADKKSYPIRWLIVFGVSVSAFFLTLISLLIFENKNYFREH